MQKLLHALPWGSPALLPSPLQFAWEGQASASRCRLFELPLGWGGGTSGTHLARAVPSWPPWPAGVVLTGAVVQVLSPFCRLVVAAAAAVAMLERAKCSSPVCWWHLNKTSGLYIFFSPPFLENSMAVMLNRYNLLLEIPS